MRAPDYTGQFKRDYKRVDMRQTHQAAAYDKWFRAEVQQGIQEADDPAMQWVPNAARASPYKNAFVEFIIVF